MPRFRTVNDAYKSLKEQDPGTSLTPYFIRMMVMNDEIPTIKAGKKFLLDFDALLEHLEKKLTDPKPQEVPITGGIRPILAGRR